MTDWYEQIKVAKSELPKEETPEVDRRKPGLSLNLGFRDILDIILFILSMIKNKQK